MQKILVTGGCGYIGSHTIVELLQDGRFEVLSVDNFLNSSADTLDLIEKLTGKRIKNYELDLCDAEGTRKIFQEHPDIKGIIHFAALKSVPESVSNPLFYYHNNLESLINLLKCADEFGTEALIFSSSCSIYGNIDVLPVSEDSKPDPIAPYGNSKYIGEQILADFSQVSPLKSVALRYFNPVGAHVSGKLGERPSHRPNNLVPIITQVAAGIREKLTIFGGDYNTRDGSCIRDYIHVTDVATAHINALDYLFANRQESNFEQFNLGLGDGVSVFEIIEAFEKIANLKLNYEVGERRAGDVEAIYSDSSKAKERLGWQAQYDLETMMASAWKWQQNSK